MYLWLETRHLAEFNWNFFFFFYKVHYLETVMSYLFAFPSIIFTDHYSNINKNRQTQTFPYKNLDSLHKCLTLHPQTGE